jgi:hypothetical protein
MTQDEIIEIAAQTKLGSKAYFGFVIYQASGTKELEAFAKLVADKATDEANARANASWTLMCNKMVEVEREACAKLAEEYGTWGGSNFKEWFDKLAAEIRNRK